MPHLPPPRHQRLKIGRLAGIRARKKIQTFCTSACCELPSPFATPPSVLLLFEAGDPSPEDCRGWGKGSSSLRSPSSPLSLSILSSAFPHFLSWCIAADLESPPRASWLAASSKDVDPELDALFASSVCPTRLLLGLPSCLPWPGCLALPSLTGCSVGSCEGALQVSLCRREATVSCWPESEDGPSSR